MSEANLPNSAKFIVGGAAGISGWMFVHPLDVLKVRCQLLGETAGGAQQSAVSVAKQVVKNEGVGGLYAGLSAAVMRQATYTTSRLGIYDILKDYNRDPNSEITLARRASAGLAAGAIASIISCPVEVSLVRMQADGRLPKEQRRGYTNVANALVRIAREEGIATYWRGAGPTVSRAMVVSCTQLATYDQFKSMIRKAAPVAVLQKDGAPLHFAASLASGFVYCFVSLPLDTAKTRMQSQSPDPVTGELRYKGQLSTLSKIATKEGPASLWKGFLPYFARGGGHTVFMFLFLEQYRRLYATYLV